MWVGVCVYVWVRVRMCIYTVRPPEKPYLKAKENCEKNYDLY